MAERYVLMLSTSAVLQFEQISDLIDCLQRLQKPTVFSRMSSDCNEVEDTRPTDTCISMPL